MPTYDYRCETCDYTFEVFEAMSADPLKPCPKCGADGPARRQIGPGAGVIFKGTGFYATDYGRRP